MSKRSYLSIALLAVPFAASAQEQSVRPGINDSFEAPDVAQFVERFEREGREIYDLREKIVAACKLRPGMSVADVGAGTGLFTRPFAEAVGPEGRVFAVDIAEEFVAHAEQACREAGLKHVVGVVCTADDAKLPEAAVDLVFICDTYHHFEFPQKTLATLHRALRPGGELVLIDFKRIEGESSDWILGHVRAGQEVFTEEIVAAGFEVVGEERDLLRENYFVRFRRK